MDNPDIEIRKLPPGIIFDLSQILEMGEGWKQLMSLIPSNSTASFPKYTVEHMNLIENAGEKQKRPCTEILLEEWGTSGRERPHISDLLKLLVKAQLFRAAEYVSVQLLKQEPPERPLTGPAARVEIPDMPPTPSAPPISTWGSECHKETLQLPQTNETQNCPDKIRHLNYDLLEAGTSDFSETRKLGSGGFGTVYLCFMNGKKTAVKRLHDTGEALQGLTEVQFKNEIQLLEGVSHPNLLPLLAYSSNGPYLCLVYEFMANGSLQDALECKDNRKALEWRERVEIALGTAKGLEYLHIIRDKPLLHRDVKSANVLLDEMMSPKVGDFGLARHGPSGKSVTMNTSTIVGTSAYMAPEAFRGDLSLKGDVFSFGVVLLEIITGLPPFDEEREDGCDLASYVDEVDNIVKLIDKKPSVPSESVPLALYEIAQKCLLEKKSRPNSSGVVKLLDEVLQLFDKF